MTIRTAAVVLCASPRSLAKVTAHWCALAQVKMSARTALRRAVRAVPGFQVGQGRQGGGDPGDAVERELGERPVPFGDQTQEPGRLGRLPRVRRGPRPSAGERGGRLTRRVLVAGQGPECEVTGLVGMLYIGNGEIRQEVSIVLTARAAGANRRLAMG